MSNTTKPFSEYDQPQIFKKTYNTNNDTLGVDGFIVGKIGRKITRTLFDSVTEDYEFFESSVSLYKLRIIYTTSALDTLLSVERIA